MRDLLKRMREEYEMTVMVSSHILGEMEAMADTVGIIHRGRMREEISLRELEGRGTSYLHLTVDDPGRASVLLSDVMHLGSFRVMKGGIIRIYDRAGRPPRRWPASWPGTMWRWRRSEEDRRRWRSTF